MTAFSNRIAERIWSKWFLILDFFSASSHFIIVFFVAPTYIMELYVAAIAVFDWSKINLQCIFIQ